MPSQKSNKCDKEEVDWERRRRRRRLMDAFLKTHNSLFSLANEKDKVLISFSGGKDSLCVLHLALKYFKTIKCFYMYLVDDLEIIENQLEYARMRFDVEIIKIPHWCYYKFKKEGIYCRPVDVSKITLREIYNYISDFTGIETILTGYKRSDSIWRRRFIKGLGKDFDKVKHPIWGWNQFDVLAYCKLNDISIPQSASTSNSGMDLTTQNLLFVYNQNKNDFDKIQQEFPFIPAAIKRHELYE